MAAIMDRGAAVKTMEENNAEQFALSAVVNLRHALKTESFDDAFSFLLLAKSDVTSALGEVKKARDDQVKFKQFDQVAFELQVSE